MDRAKLQGLLKESIPKKIRDTVLLRAFGLMRIPLLFSVHPTIVELNDERAVVRIKLSRWTRNHLGSMYFGTLAIGADCCVGMAAMQHIWRLDPKKKIQLVFKDFQANFLKRPDGHVLFICDAGQEAGALVQAALDTGERQNLSMKARAVLESDPAVSVAEFALTLSLKRKG